ncbi:MAG: leucyl aminopeptidase [Calditrichia bacterium]
MEIKLYTSGIEQCRAALLAVPVFEDSRNIPGKLEFLAASVISSVTDIFRKSGFEAKFNQKILLHTQNDSFPLVACLGAGKVNEWDLEKSRQWWGNAAGAVKSIKADNLAIYWDSTLPAPGDSIYYMSEMVAALITADYRVSDFMTEKDDLPASLRTVFILYPGGGEDLDSRIVAGERLGNSVNLARRLAETPSNLMTPARFADEVKSLSERYGWHPEILEKHELEENNFGALLAVARGSENPPVLAIARYQHPEARKTLALVGKGVTFDSGGISIKPSRSMEEMKYDMCGAAAVLGALQAISLTGLPVNAVAAMPLVENMPSGKAVRPGDVVKSFSGKTIEIINTDAEGRLILADTLSYVEKNYKPDYIIDIATLTGAVVVTLGNLAAAVFSGDPNLLETLKEASGLSGEKIWELPLWDEYRESLKSKIADIRNVSAKPGAGSITAAMFLKSFVEATAWAHLDIAGTAYGMPEKSYRPEGATGFGVRLLWYLADLLSAA